MGLLVRVAVVAATVSLAMAAISFQAAQDPDKPDHCLMSVPLGATWNLPGCSGATCNGPPNRMHVTYATCGLIGVDPPCWLTATDYTKPYPQCCPDQVCPKD